MKTEAGFLSGIAVAVVLALIIVRLIPRSISSNL
jgi:hypothetical protein